MSTDASAQQKRENLLRQVLDNPNPCPTLLDLDGLVAKQLDAEEGAGTFTPNRHEQWVEQHIPDCESCQEAYQGLVTLAKASRKALENVSRAG